MKSFFDANLALAQTVSHLVKEQKRKEQTTSFGVNSMGSQVLY